MARALYLPADARCRQLERIVRKQPGITMEDLAAAASISYRAAVAYTVRLGREARLVVRFAEPATPRGSTKFLFPPGTKKAG